ncbi:hypothetical protein [Bacillus infantis]|uniref:hypothetical protein n=1 Tax=Bacillus infantis TaxID=324767 RepID=UPI003CE740D7
MRYALLIMLVSSMSVLFICGYFTAVIKAKYGKTWLHAVPAAVAVLMFNIIFVLVEMAKAGRWE